MIDHEVWQRDSPEQKEKKMDRNMDPVIVLTSSTLYSQNRKLAKFINEHNVISICASPGPISKN